MEFLDFFGHKNMTFAGY